ncbi:MAG: CarD family transcriptional regulator [Lachnospiraceae bacterium]|nr:CarD family transcriptional regulator [Lachnospiraceae bacterium]
MFEKGDFIVYGNTGVCEVKDITTLDMKGAPKNRLYYILSPSHRKESKIFTPVEGNKTVMRAVLTKEEADVLIENIPVIEELWVGNDKLREEKYKETMRSCDCRDWIKIIKTLYMRKKERIAQGKKTTAMDEKYLRMAEENLYSELSFALGIPKEQMEGYIIKCMAKLQQEK